MPKIGEVWLKRIFNYKKLWHEKLKDRTAVITLNHKRTKVQTQS